MTSLDQYRLLGRSGLRVSPLDAASAPEPIFPACFVGRPLAQQLLFGGSNAARPL